MSKQLPVTKVVIFRGRNIRKTIHNNEWWFSVVDVVQALTDQPDDSTLSPVSTWGISRQRFRYLPAHNPVYPSAPAGISQPHQGYLLPAKGVSPIGLQGISHRL
ncbi:MAG: hypothetical protein AB1599_09790 [Planctomycetota bacterium]